MSFVHHDALCVMQQVTNVPYLANLLYARLEPKHQRMEGVVQLLLMDIILLSCFNIASTEEASRLSKAHPYSAS